MRLLSVGLSLCMVLTTGAVLAAKHEPEKRGHGTAGAPAEQAGEGRFKKGKPWVGDASNRDPDDPLDKDDPRRSGKGQKD